MIPGQRSKRGLGHPLPHRVRAASPAVRALDRGLLLLWSAIVSAAAVVLPGIAGIAARTTPCRYLLEKRFYQTPDGRMAG